MLRRENRKEWVITEPGKDSPNGSKNRERVWSRTMVGFILLCVNIYILMNTHSYPSMLRRGCQLGAHLRWWTFSKNTHSNIPSQSKVMLLKLEQWPISSVFFPLWTPNSFFFFFTLRSELLELWGSSLKNQICSHLLLFIDTQAVSNITVKNRFRSDHKEGSNSFIFY